MTLPLGAKFRLSALARLSLVSLTSEEVMTHKNTPADAIRIVGSISLIVLPMLLAIAFALHYTALSDFFEFRLVKPPYSAERLLHTLTSPDGGFRHYTLPHLVGYLALPLFIPASLALASAIVERAPWHALLGAALTCFGVVFMGGVFGAWMSFAAVGGVSGEAASNLLPVLQALTTMQGSLMLSSVLSAFTFLGMIVLGFGLYQSRIAPRWSAALFILGNVLVLAFIDLDNWMFVGALLMMVGMLPLGMRLFHSGSTPLRSGPGL